MIDLPTGRLRIVQAAPSFAAACAVYARANREHHAPWSPTRDSEYFEPEFWETRLASAVAAFDAGTSYAFLVIANEAPERIAGEINFSNLIRGAFHAGYLGYALDGTFVGRGIMREALRAALRWAFDEGKLHRVMANYMPSNKRSAAVLQALGFRIEGVAPDYLFLDGAWRDHVLTALHADEFSAG